MAFNIHYDDLNTFTKKIKNYLYKYSLPENPTLLNVLEKKIQLKYRINWIKRSG